MEYQQNILYHDYSNSYSRCSIIDYKPKIHKSCQTYQISARETKKCTRQGESGKKINIEEGNKKKKKKKNKTI